MPSGHCGSPEMRRATKSVLAVGCLLGIGQCGIPAMAQMRGPRISQRARCDLRGQLGTTLSDEVGLETWEMTMAPTTGPRHLSGSVHPISRPQQPFGFSPCTTRALESPRKAHHPCSGRQQHQIHHSGPGIRPALLQHSELQHQRWRLLTPLSAFHVHVSQVVEAGHHIAAGAGSFARISAPISPRVHHKAAVHREGVKDQRGGHQKHQQQ